MMRVLPGGVAAAPSQQCPQCHGRRCNGCLWEGTREGWELQEEEATLRDELVGVSDAQLSEMAARHALALVESLRSTRARYVAGLLREVMRRAGIEA